MGKEPHARCWHRERKLVDESPLGVVGRGPPVCDWRILPLGVLPHSCGIHKIAIGTDLINMLKAK